MLSGLIRSLEGRAKALSARRGAAMAASCSSCPRAAAWPQRRHGNGWAGGHAVRSQLFGGLYAPSADGRRFLIAMPALSTDVVPMELQINRLRPR